MLNSGGLSTPQCIHWVEHDAVIKNDIFKDIIDIIYSIDILINKLSKKRRT